MKMRACLQLACLVCSVHVPAHQPTHAIACMSMGCGGRRQGPPATRTGPEDRTIAH